MRKAEIVLWVAAAALAIAVTVVCWQSTPAIAPGPGADPSTELSLDDYGLVAFQIDLNTAGQAELMRLPGMTVETAQAVLAYRNYYGRFTDVREIGNVEGVTEEQCERWIFYLTLGAPADGAESSR